MGALHIASSLPLGLIEVSGVGPAVFFFLAAPAYWRYGERLMAFCLGNTPEAKERASRYADRAINYRSAGTVTLLFFGVVNLMGVLKG